MPSPTLAIILGNLWFPQNKTKLKKKMLREKPKPEKQSQTHTFKVNWHHLSTLQRSVLGWGCWAPGESCVHTTAERWHCCIVVRTWFSHQMLATGWGYTSELRHSAFKCHILSSVFKGKRFSTEGSYFKEVLKKMSSQARFKKKVTSRVALFKCRE